MNPMSHAVGAIVKATIKIKFGLGGWLPWRLGNIYFWSGGVRTRRTQGFAGFLCSHNSELPRFARLLAFDSLCLRIAYPVSGTNGSFFLPEGKSFVCFKGVA